MPARVVPPPLVVRSPYSSLCVGFHLFWKVEVATPSGCKGSLPFVGDFTPTWYWRPCRAPASHGNGTWQTHPIGKLVDQ